MLMLMDMCVGWTSVFGDWNTIAVIILSLFHIAGVLYSIHVLKNVRSSQGAVAWIGGLLVVPVITVPLYMLAGRTRYENYLKARKKLKQELGEMYDQLRSQTAKYKHQPTSKLIAAVAKIITLETTSGNEYELLIDGEAKFAKVFEELESAEDYIFVEYYTIKDDEIGTKLKESLIRQAQRGVRVYVLYDSFGSMGLSKSYLKELEQAGIECRSFGIKKKILSRFQLNFRNHRKIIIVDGKKAFTGGINVGDEYLGRNKEYGDWRDTHLFYAGPAVLNAQAVFLEDWYWGSGERLEANWEVYVSDKASDDASLVSLAVCEMGPADDHATWQMVIAVAAAQAQEKLWIASPYLAPDEGVITALKAAAMRGVDVRVMYPEKGDQLLVKYAGYTFQKDLMPIGVKIYKYADGFMHQKVMLVDDDCALVGSANLDYRSMRLNFEVNMMSGDKIFIDEVEKMLVNDFADSRKLDAGDLEGKGFWFTLFAYFTRLFLPIL